MHADEHDVRAVLDDARIEPVRPFLRARREVPGIAVVQRNLDFRNSVLVGSRADEVDHVPVRHLETGQADCGLGFLEGDADRAHHFGPAHAVDILGIQGDRMFVVGKAFQFDRDEKTVFDGGFGERIAVDAVPDFRRLVVVIHDARDDEVLAEHFVLGRNVDLDDREIGVRVDRKEI